MGYRFQFITLAGFHALNHSMFDLAHGYARSGMSAYVELQEREFASEADGYTATRHQREVGAGYFDRCGHRCIGRRVVDAGAPRIDRGGTVRRGRQRRLTTAARHFAVKKRRRTADTCLMTPFSPAEAVGLLFAQPDVELEISDGAFIRVHAIRIENDLVVATAPRLSVQSGMEADRARDRA